MFRFRNLAGIGIAVAMLILMTSWVAAAPNLQGTATPEPGTSPVNTPVATTAATDTPVPTVAATDTPMPTATAVAPAVTPQATPQATPSTLPTTGGSDDGTAALSLLLVVAGAVILAGALGLALSRRSR